MTVCVTGPMAAGKNAASDILVQKGFAAVDADQLAHTAIENPYIIEEIVAAFGPLAREQGRALLTPEGRIDRRQLGAVIFADAALVARQEAIVYPEITRLFTQFIAVHPRQNIALNAAVLYKIPVLMQAVDRVLYIDAPAPLRYFRARRRDGLAGKHIRERFLAQRHLFAKYAECHADIVRVWNVGTRHSLARKIERFLAGAKP